jgi:hypothetical protein
MKELQYRTYDELLASVLSDFKTYDQEGMIDPQDLIKVAQSINKELTIKIHQLKEAVLDVNKCTVRLPNDFYSLNFALLCSKYEVTVPVMHGTNTEDVIAPPVVACAANSANNHPVVCLSTCGKDYSVVQRFKYETRTYQHFLPIHIEDSARVSTRCPNKFLRAERSAYIKAGWLYTNFDNGVLYINYMGSMEDDEGNLLVLDHPIVNNYYEYALKERILENMLVEGESVGELLRLMAVRKKNARLEARNVVFTPDFSELKEVWETNRRQQYDKYYRMFQSVPYVG